MANDKPYLERLRRFFKATPPRRILEDPILAAHLERVAKMDIAARRAMKLRMKRLPLLLYAGWESSSGFRMATELRRFWYEYFNRFGRFGPTSLPSSFNVLEAFVRFDEHYLTFFPLREREHLLRFSQYLDWYTASSFPEEPRSLIDIMEEGVSYSYDFVLDPTEPLLAAKDANLLMVGISLIRHRDELCLLVLAGETPPNEGGEVEPDHVPKGKENIGPAEGLTEDDRLLEGMPSYSRVLLASRFDLSNRLNDVRYVLRDLGRSYQIATDDFEMLRYSFHGTVSREKLRELEEAQSETLRRYSDLFSAAATSIFLPAFFIDQARNVVTSEFVTSMGLDPQRGKVRRLRRELGQEYFRPRASIACLIRRETNQETIERYTVQPPKMNFSSSGYWKPLDPGQIGSSADGLPIMGKTWVHRTEVWTSTSPEEFFATRFHEQPHATEAEVIYVMRSPSHSTDIYKIGSTTRRASNRQRELSGATSTPLPFEILASWYVADARAIEKAVHEALAPYRLTPRREFFRLPLSQIVRTIERIVSDHFSEQ